MLPITSPFCVVSSILSALSLCLRIAYFTQNFYAYFTLSVHDKDLSCALEGAAGALCDSGRDGLPPQLGGTFVPAPQRDDYLFLFPKITLALSDSFFRLVKSNTFSDFEHYF